MSRGQSTLTRPTATSHPRIIDGSRPPTIWTIGYERLLPAELVAELQAAGVERLIDVRYRPQSRRPGMSKTRLGELLGDHGIVYDSRKALGTPPDIRFHYKSGKPAEGAPLFRAHVEEHAAHELDDLADELDRGPRTALLCLEADPAVCHRRVLTELLRARCPGLEVVDLQCPADPHAIGGIAAFAPTFLLTRRPTGRPVPEPAR